jgi:hypothetical protein
MKRLVLTIIFALSLGLVLINCSENDRDLNDTDLSKRPEIPINDSLDLNSDQIFDFVISYNEFATDDKLSSGGSIIGSISPLNQNLLLYRGNVGHLFLNINDTIRKVLNTNSDWNGYSADLISIDRDNQNWDRKWTILSENAEFYFLAYKIVLNDFEKIGWICLEFDTTNGKISITDGDISDNNELEIQKKTID